MWNLFMNSVGLKIQIFIMMGLVLIITMGSIGGVNWWLFDKTQKLNQAYILLEKSEVDFAIQMDEWKNILLRGYDKKKYKIHLQRFNDLEKLTIQHFGEAKSILDELGEDTQSIGLLIEHHDLLKLHHQEALDLFEPSKPLNYREIDAKTQREEDALLHALESVIVEIIALVSEEANAVFRVMMVVCFLVVIMVILIIMVYTRALSARLGRVADATAEITKGNLAVRIRANGVNELAILGQSFDQMANRLSELVGNVQQSGAQLSSSSVSISATTKEQAASAKEQEATTHEIMATSQHISQTARDLVNNMDEVARAVDDTSSLAAQSHEGLTRMSDTVEQMVEASQNISDKLTVLNEKANNINAVVTTINKIADQTNLLSVNAAIEADKAGEYGVGFSTVATEIRRLADQTAVATYDIENMVKEMQAAVSAGVMGMEKFSDEIRQGVDETQQVSGQLNLIVEKVQTLAPHFDSVHEGMRSQSDGAEQIQEALSQLGDTIRNLNDSMRMSNNVVDELNEESERLKESVSFFQFTERT